MQSSLGAVPKGQPQSHEHHSERPSFKYLHTPSASLSHHDFPRKAPRSQVANLFYGSCGIPSDEAGQDAGGAASRGLREAYLKWCCCPFIVVTSSIINLTDLHYT